MRKRYSPEEIIGELRSAEVWPAEGVSVGERGFKTSGLHEGSVRFLSAQFP